MVGIVNVILAFLAAVLTYESGHTVLGILAFVLPLIALWTWAMMLRYNPALIKMRLDRLKRQIRSQQLFADEYARIEEHLQTALKVGLPAIPRWIRAVGALTFLCSMGLLIWGASAVLG